MSWNEAPEPVTIRAQRRIGDITGMVTIEESGTDDLEITQHPVQRGAAITDHAYVKPSTLNVRMVFGEADRPLEETYQQLLDLQASREPFEIVTGKRVYRDMLFKSISVTTDKSTERVLSVAAGFQQVILVDVVLTTVPARAKQKQPGKTGATIKAGMKQAKPVESAAERTSVLNRIGSAVGRVLR